MLSKISDVNPVACLRALRQGWNELLDDYFSRRLTAGKGIRLNRTAAGTTISTIASPGGGGTGGGGDGYANYFAVEFTRDDTGTVTGVRIFDGGNPDSIDAGLSDVGFVGAGTVSGPFSEGDYICLRLTVTTTPNGFVYSHSYEKNTWTAINNATAPLWVLAEIRDGAVVQRWTGGIIYWRSRFVVGFPRG